MLRPRMPPAPGPREEEARLTGARAEFAGSLPRRLETLRSALAAAEQDPSDSDRVKSLLRRVHAVCSAARVLGFASVAEALAEAERSLRQAATAGKPAPFEEISRAFDVLPSLVLGAAVSVRGADARPRGATPAWPTSVLLLGSQALADAITDPEGTPPVECERLADASRLVELAHIVGPDVVVVDGDQEGARDAVRKLVTDELIEPTPVIVVGAFTQPEMAAAFVDLGVARVLPKPCSPDTLKRSIDELRERSTRPRVLREPLGELSMNGLAERIAGEFKRGLVDALEATAPNTRVALGEGNDVLAAVWGAVARVRELVTLRSSGTLRFQRTGPEGGVPIAAWIGGERRAGERAGGSVRDTGGVSLQGRRIVVADDDPAVVWFMAGLLRAVGVEVLEAHDGKKALELAFEHWPDAIVSDVLMPKLDGFSLCHEVKRDVALRDVPVILLSWKEDLLQRVRELGASADGYLRKEAAASAVVERVREILRARARVEERMAAGGEVRGRLDGLTPRLVLQLACRDERDARVSVRDAAFLFEAQIRRGKLVSLSRSAADGSFLRGPAVLGSLLGAGAGRFSVEPDSSHCRSELGGELFEVLREPIANARAALRAVSTEGLLRLDRVELDKALLETYLACTPEPAAFVTRRLLEGQSPREMILSGAVSAHLLEVVLSDIARRGGVLSVVPAPGLSVRPTPVQSSAPPAATPGPETAQNGATEPRGVANGDVPPSGAPNGVVETADAGWLALHEAAANPAPGAASVSSLPPSSDRLRVEGEAAKLPFNHEQTPSDASDAQPMLVFGEETLQGIGAKSAAVELGDEALGLVGAAAADAPASAASRPPEQKVSLAPAISSSNPPVMSGEPLEPDTSPAIPAAKRRDTPRAPAVPDLTPNPDSKREGHTSKSSGSTPAPQSVTSDKKSGWGSLLLRSAAAGGVAFFVTTWIIVPMFSSEKESAPPAAKLAEPPAAPTPSAEPAPSALALTVEELEPPRGMELAPGQGMIEVETGGPDPIYVDDAFVGLGPMRRVAAAAGAHSVQVKGERALSPLELKVSAGKRARVTETGPGSAVPATSAR
jgi:DNA-binding response OmpR family regulator/HPt (histidine-containing phosphotransfer) domain-containing protein